VAAYADVLADFRARLNTRGFDLRGTGIEVAFNTPMFDTPIFALPDVHLGAGDGGDIFLQGEMARAAKLEAIDWCGGVYGFVTFDGAEIHLGVDLT